jgi:riboflavin kinase/FMN adenylyltransferase
MRVVYSLEDAQLTEDSVVTIGAFDGIHRGHQAIVESVRRAALDQGRASVVVTFFPHPSVVLGRNEPFYLTSPEEKIALLNASGIDLLVIMPFTLETAQIRAADFVSMLIDDVRMRELHVGYDFAFGYKREGTVEFLKRISAERGFSLRQITPLTNGAETVGSTGIRQALREGNVERAAAWLGRPFRLSGVVVKGDGRGRKIGVPTANLDVWREHAVPANGVYASRAWVGNLRFKAAVNVGVRPTVTDQSIRTVEAHILDFDRDIYGMNVALDFVARLRGEQKFPSLDALVAQIRSDVEETRRRLVE